MPRRSSTFSWRSPLQHRVAAVVAASLLVLGYATGVIAEPLATTPFELNSNKIYIEVEVAGKSRWFILDSGAPTVFLDRDFATTLDVQHDRGADTEAGLGEKRIEMSQAANVALRIGTLELPAQDVGVMPLNEVLRGFEGRDVGGLIGNDVISRYVVEIDYERSFLHWHDPATFEYTGKGRRVPVTFDQHPFIALRIAPPSGPVVEGMFLLDIGVRNGVMLFAPYCAKHDLFEKTPRTVFTTVGCGIGGEVRGHVARMSSVEMGGYTLEEPLVTLSRDTVGLQSTSDYDGILGAEILKRFRLLLDYGHQQVILEPNAEFGKPFEFDASGLVLAAEGDDLRSFHVLRVIEGSPAVEAGLRAGDEIVAVDGRSASKLTLESLRASLVAPGKTREIAVRRGGQTSRAKLTLRRLV